MNREIISTSDAPKAVGAYSQAVRVGDTVYLSGQIPLDPKTSQLVEGDFSNQLRRVFKNLSAVAEASGGCLADIVKLTIYLVTMDHYAEVNSVMAEFWEHAFPARSCFAVKELPKGAIVEVDAILIL